MSNNLTTIRRSVQMAACLALLLVSASRAKGQGTFRNLNFEQASVSATPVNGYGGEVDPALLFPGWTVGSDTNAYHLFTLYNNLTLDSPAVDLMGPLFPNAVGITSLQGSYSPVLQYSAYFHEMTFLSQTGLIPTNARSISFAISSTAGIYAPTVTLNGVNLNLVSIGGGRLAGDVTSFAGSTADLRFNAVNWITLFDDAQFSPQSIPEPGILSLFVLGALLSGSRALYRRYQISAANQSRQPTPGARFAASWTSLARRGCAHRSDKAA